MMTEQATTVRLERTIPAPPERVYRAWLDPRLLVRWMAPGPFDITRAEVDERPGGHYRIWHAEGRTPTGGFECELAELVPHERIVFRWGFAGPERRSGPVYDSLLTVAFRPAPDGGAVLTLVHERLDDLAVAMPDAAANVSAGWADVLGKLAGLLSGEDAPAASAASPAAETAPAVAEIADLSLPGAVELLEHQPLARLGYTGPDGFPRVIPIGFLWTGGRIVVCTAPSSPKVRALAARPQVALTIDTEDGPASRAVSVRGVASTEIVDGIPGEYLAASAKTMSGELPSEFEASVRSLYQQMARISIEPRWARYYDFGAGRLPEFLHKLISEASAR